MDGEPGLPLAWQSGPFLRDPDRPYSVFTSIEGIAPVNTGRAVRHDCRERRTAWRWAELRTGAYTVLRCKSPNRCEYCRQMAAREWVEMMQLAADEVPPVAYIVLTTSEFLTPADLNQTFHEMRRAARADFWPLEWSVALEWQSRGAIHVNMMVHGMMERDAGRVFDLLWSVWRSRHRAVRAAQSWELIDSHAGVARYVRKLARYVAKGDQTAPPDWRGHTTRQSRGYLPRPASVMREEARASLAWKSLVRMHVSLGCGPLEAGFRAADGLGAYRDGDWVLTSIGGPLAPLWGKPAGYEVMRSKPDRCTYERPSVAIERDMCVEYPTEHMFDSSGYCAWKSPAHDDRS